MNQPASYPHPSNTPSESPPPMPGSAPPPVKKGGIVGKLVKTAGIIAVLFVALVVLAMIFGPSRRKEYKFSDKESVYYSGKSTEADARTLGKALQDAGYFNGSATAHVLLQKEDSGVTLSYVVKDGAWDNPMSELGLKIIAQEVAPSIGGTPLTVRLVDSGLNTKKEFKVDGPPPRKEQ